MKNTLSLRPNPSADLKGYLEHYPQECEALSAFKALLDSEGAALLSRGHHKGHIVASGLVLDRNVQKVLVIHHRAIGLWLAPGGHYEGAGTLRAAAAREVQEETGYAGALPLKHPVTGSYLLDIDAHMVPGNPAKGEGPHWHYDYIFLFEGDAAAELVPQQEEVLGAKWLSLPEYCLTTERAQRISDKLQALVLPVEQGKGRSLSEETPPSAGMPDDVNAFFDALSESVIEDYDEESVAESISLPRDGLGELLR